MKISKYFNIDPNVLIEYIYDDSNLIGEPYNILFNTKSEIKSFISTDELRPPVKGFKKTNNDAYNQLYKIDTIQQKYARIPLSSSGANKIDSDNFSFLQIRNFPTSIPVRYDTIKVHIPINWTFGEYKGFYLRVFTYNFDNTKIIELSNFYFNMTDVDHSYKLEYSSPILNINEQQWGKYVPIQIPAATKISDQRRFNVTRENSINFNLSDGLGLSKNSPVFMDFHLIENIITINNIDYFDLTSKTSLTVPQTPEFEKLGVKIEESTQGDFFLIYGTYNGTIAEFENFIDESYYEGNRYYVEYQVDLYEKNTRTKTSVFPVTEDFGDEIEYRPILKFTTTTAIIDVSMRLIDNVDGTFIERKASYGLLQGGGAKMGSEYNPRLNVGIQNIGAGDISKYARSLTKIELKKSKRQEVINIKSTTLPTTGTDPFGTKPILKLEKLPFNLFSSNYYFINSDQSYNFNNVNYIANNQSVIYLYPFDNIIKLKILNTSETEEIPYNLTTLEDLKMVIKSDSKDLSFDIYRDSAENDLENGIVVFRVSIGHYQSLKKINNTGFNLFYIVGIDENSIKQIVYSGRFLPWDSFSNLNKLETNFVASQAITTPIILRPPPVNNEIAIVPEEDIIPKGVNTSNVDTPSVQQITQEVRNQVSGISKSGLSTSGFSFRFNPRWKADTDSILLSNNLENYQKPKDSRELIIQLTGLGFLTIPKIRDILGKKEIISANNDLNNIRISYLLGYFKGLNVNPNSNNLEKFFNTENLKSDLSDYVNSGISKQRTKKGIGLKDTEVTVGEFVPKNRKDFNLILTNKIVDQNILNKRKRTGTFNQGEAPPPAPPTSPFGGIIPPFREYRLIFPVPIFPRALANNIGFDWDQFKALNSIKNNLRVLVIGRTIKLPSTFNLSTAAKLFLIPK
jgi:hypothetical protein